ncbi:MAG: PHP domain-containing protein [Oscillospiraceae bacterium]|nr:PHP domain-containing protein [Oscillospiraceae bacterium]
MRIEMHIHTSEVSPCAQCSAAEAVRRCVSKGYDGMVVTDHCNEDASRAILGELAPWPARVEGFLRGYEAAKEAAPAGFLVLLGMELRFMGRGSSEYLVYGFDEQFLYDNEGIDRLDIQRFSQIARENGLLVVQAHPFRWGMTITRASFLDGMEVYNGNAHHQSHNDFAALWARRHGLLPLSGSDYHGGDTGDGVAPGGIRLREPVRDAKELVKAIRERRYTVL